MTALEDMAMIDVETDSNRHWNATVLQGITMLLRIGMAFAVATLLLIGSARAALIEGSSRSDLLFGADDDNLENPIIQPAGAANQSLTNTDVMDGRSGNDVMIGLLGADVMHGGPGHDILVGGTEQGAPPNSDVMYGDEGRDVALWRGGDGSDVFVGGPGPDTLVMGAIDRDANNIPVISPAAGRYEATGLPTADVTGQNGFCTLEDVRDQELGYDFLVRFFVKSTGALAVTMRVAEVEQVFCTSETAAAITFADLREPNPSFVEIPLEEVAEISETVAQIVR
jgi:Ca2+-binding RTX toxin-like protein